MTDQIAFGTTEFVDNPAPRCPCLLLLDISASMNGMPIAELNKGLITFKDELAADQLAMKSVEVAIVTFGPVRTELAWQGAASFYPPTLSTQGDTPMGEAICQGLDMVRQRKDEYRAHGISCYRPWVFLITDGGPTDEWQSAAADVREGEASNAFSFFTIGVRGANMEILKQISVREPLMLDGLRFRDFFLWLTATLRSVSRTIPGTKFLLPPPTGWTSV